jgi:hypothetical protein
MTRDTRDDDWLDAALAADGAEHRARHVDDDGFTFRVIGALPPPIALPAWRQRAVVALWAAGGVGLAFALPATFADVAREAFRLIAQPVSLAGIAAAIGCAAAATFAAAAYALRGD